MSIFGQNGFQRTMSGPLNASASMLPLIQAQHIVIQV